MTKGMLVLLVIVALILAYTLIAGALLCSTRNDFSKDLPVWYEGQVQKDCFGRTIVNELETPLGYLYIIPAGRLNTGEQVSWKDCLQSGVTYRFYKKENLKLIPMQHDSYFVECIR